MNKIRAESILVWYSFGASNVEEIENRILEEVDCGFISQEDYQYLLKNWNEISDRNGALRKERKRND